MFCQVNASSVKDFSLHINQVRLNSNCQMKMNSVTMRNITVASSSELFFKNCFPEDVEVTAKSVIGKSRFTAWNKKQIRIFFNELV